MLIQLHLKIISVFLFESLWMCSFGKRGRFTNLFWTCSDRIITIICNRSTSLLWYWFLQCSSTFFIEVQVCVGYFCTLLVPLGSLWSRNQVGKYLGYLLMYTNNFPLDIIAVEIQNQTRMGGWVSGGWLDQLRI